MPSQPRLFFVRLRGQKIRTVLQVPIRNASSDELEDNLGNVELWLTAWLCLWLIELSSQNVVYWWWCWEQAGGCSQASQRACFINEGHLWRCQVWPGFGSLEKVTHASCGLELIHWARVLRACVPRHLVGWVLGVRTNDVLSPTSRVTFKLLFLKEHSGFAD